MAGKLYQGALRNGCKIRIAWYEAESLFLSS